MLLLAYRFVSKAVQRRGTLHPGRVPFPRHIFLGKTGERPEPLGFRPATLDHIPEVEIVNAIRELKAQERMVGVRWRFLFGRRVFAGGSGRPGEGFPHPLESEERLPA